MIKVIDIIRSNLNRLVLILVALFAFIPSGKANWMQNVIILVSAMNLVSVGFDLIKNKKFEDKLQFYLFVCVGLILIYFLVNAIAFPNFNSGIYRFSAILSAVLVTLSAYSSKYDKIDLLIIKVIAITCVLFYFIHWVVVGFISGFQFSQFASIYGSSNSLGAVMFMVIIFSLLTLKKKPIEIATLALSLFILLISGTRSVMIAVAVIVVLYLLFNLLKEKDYKWIFFVALGLIMVFPLVYVLLADTGVGDFINNIFLSLTGKNFFSGRQKLWASAFKYIGANPFFGVGLGADIQMLISDPRSLHNWFIQILMRGGIIGLALLVAPMIIFSFKHYQNKSDKKSVLLYAVIIGVALWQSFEVTLTENILSLGLIYWFIMGMNSFSTKDK